MFWIARLGETDYEEAFRMQKEWRRLRIEGKIPDLFLTTSHPPVYTLGKRDCREDFLSSPGRILEDGIVVIQSNRGGRITYHGPGQLVGYFIVNIRELRLSIPQFVRKVEEVLILTLKDFGLETRRDPEYPGVWVGEKKIAALGLHFDRGVSLHGFALNVNPALEHYRHIIPCGIRGRSVTSMEKELGRTVKMVEVEASVEKSLSEVFAVPTRIVSPKDLFSPPPKKGHGESAVPRG
ncbi:MAG: lipoyl(octanoyl) transferase LipB [bacterium]